MAKKDFWGEEWSDHSQAKEFRKDDKHRGGWGDRPGRGGGGTGADHGAGGQREVTPPWREQRPAASHAPHGNEPGQQDNGAASSAAAAFGQMAGSSQHNPLAQWAHMWPMPPGIAHGYPMQHGYPLANALALGPPVMPPPHMVPTQPRGRPMSENWGAGQGSSSGERTYSAGRSRSGRFRDYRFPRHSRLQQFDPMDWVCGGCYWINFAKNRQCQKCEFRPPVLGRDPEQGGSIFVKDALGMDVD